MKVLSARPERFPITVELNPFEQDVLYEILGKTCGKTTTAGEVCYELYKALESYKAKSRRLMQDSALAIKFKG